MAAKSFKCPKCPRTFGMKAHLARHLTTIHAPGGAKKTAKKKTSKKRAAGKRKVGRPKKRLGRPKGTRRMRSVGGVVLSEMSLDDLGKLIGAARAVARDKITHFEKAIG